MKIGNVDVDSKWFTSLETPGKSLSETHVQGGLLLLKKRIKENPEHFSNKSILMIGVSSFKSLDDSYVEFLDDKDAFRLEKEAEKEFLGLRSDVNYIIGPVWLKQKCWIPILFDLKKKTMTAMDVASAMIKREEKEKYIGSYAQMMPYIIRSIRNKDMDISPFKIIIDKTVPQVDKAAETGVYMLKMMECYLMKNQDLSKISKDRIINFRKKLASDLFAELKNF